MSGPPMSHYEPCGVCYAPGLCICPAEVTRLRAQVATLTRERDEARAEVERLRDVLNELAAGLPRDDVWATLTRDDVEGWVMETARAALKGGDRD